MGITRHIWQRTIFFLKRRLMDMVINYTYIHYIQEQRLFFKPIVYQLWLVDYTMMIIKCNTLSSKKLPVKFYSSSPLTKTSMKLLHSSIFFVILLAFNRPKARIERLHHENEILTVYGSSLSLFPDDQERGKQLLIFVSWYRISLYSGFFFYLKISKLAQ